MNIYNRLKNKLRLHAISTVGIINRVELKGDDIIVVIVYFDATEDVQARMLAKLRDIFPDHKIVILIGATLSILGKAEIDELIAAA